MYVFEIEQWQVDAWNAIQAMDEDDLYDWCEAGAIMFDAHDVEGTQNALFEAVCVDRRWAEEIIYD